MESIEVLEGVALGRSLTRITHEILERHKGTQDLVLIGIKTRGVFLAERIAEKIAQFEQVDVPVGTLDITLYRDDRHDSELNQDPTINGTSIPFDVSGKSVVLVDDVLFTGRTIRSAMDAVMDLGRAKRVTVAVLVDRGHRELPIKADYIGKNIPTSLTEQVSVQLVEVDGRDGVYIVRDN